MKNYLKGLIKSKTIIFNTFVAVMAAVETNFEFIKSQNPDYYMYIMMTVTAINFILRTVTVESIKDKVEMK